MKMAQITYLLNEEGRKQSLLQGGDGKEVQVIQTEVTPEILGLGSVDRDGEVELKIGFSYQTKSPLRIALDYEISNIMSGIDKPKITEVLGLKIFNTPQTVDELLQFEQNRKRSLAQKKEALQPELDRLVKEWDVKQAEKEAQLNAKKQSEEEERKARISARLKRERDKEEWIKKNGSDYLKTAHELDYDCQRRYVTERSNYEFPEYVVDFDDKADWKSRSCPSEEALMDVKGLVEQGFDARVVWLTKGLIMEDEDEYIDSFERLKIWRLLPSGKVWFKQLKL
jgi:hypothetical protein